jgi:uncharacterized membrane protein
MSMDWKSRSPAGRFRLREEIEIGAPTAVVYERWNRYEDLPDLLENVRRIHRIDEQRVLWEADVAGRQVVWEARIVEQVPPKRVRWESTWGAANRGEVSFEELPDDRTRVTIEMVFETDGPLEALGARLGLVDLQVRRDLARFRDALESERHAQPLRSATIGAMSVKA